MRFLASTLSEYFLISEWLQLSEVAVFYQYGSIFRLVLLEPWLSKLQVRPQKQLPLFNTQ